MRRYCELCNKEVDTKIVLRKETYEVFGERIDVEAKVRVCVICGEDLYDEKLDTETLKKAYYIYRKKHKLLLPEEIKEIREKYGLSQRSFSKLLNWGDKTIFRYENGSLQDKAHNALLTMLQYPEQMQLYLKNNETSLTKSQLNKLSQRIQEILEKIDSNVTLFDQNMEHMYQNEKPSINNGYKSFDGEKFSALVSYILSKEDGIYKTKLLKLINYVDMLYYKLNGISLTGLTYIHMPYGPVPKNYNVLFDALECQNLIELTVEYLNNGSEANRMILKDQSYSSQLTEDETDVVDQVLNKFKKYSAKEILDYSHQEKGYQETVKGEIITYDYAKDIDLARPDL